MIKNLKVDQLRLLPNPVAKSKANGVLFISGDRHWAELSRLERPGDYPIYDLTSSALTQKHARGTPTPNIYRLGPTWHDANLGLITIEWKPSRPTVVLNLIDVEGRSRIYQKCVNRW